MQLQAIPTASNLQGLVLFPTISRRKHSKSTSARLVEISTDLGTRGPRFESALPDFWSVVAESHAASVPQRDPNAVKTTFPRARAGLARPLCLARASRFGLPAPGLAPRAVSIACCFSSSAGRSLSRILLLTSAADAAAQRRYRQWLCRGGCGFSRPIRL